MGEGAGREQGEREREEEEDNSLLELRRIRVKPTVAP